MAKKEETVETCEGDETVQPAIEVAGRAQCICGQPLARIAGKDRPWSCIRVVNGNPTKACQKNIRKRVLTKSECEQEDQARQAKLAEG